MDTIQFTPVYDNRNHRIWTNQEIDCMLNHLSDGWASIGNAMGRTVAAVMAKYNTLFPPTPVSAADITAIRKLRKQGLTRVQIAEQMGLSERTVAKYVKDLKIKNYPSR